LERRSALWRHRVSATVADDREFLLTVITDAFAGICMFSTAWLADKYRIRGPIIAGNAIVTIIGLAMMGWAPGIPAQYAGVFFTCAGANSNIPHMMSWQANNIRGQWKRAFCSATLVAFGGIGGIAGSLVFRFVNSNVMCVYGGSIC
jgi:hypothetical protein